MKLLDKKNRTIVIMGDELVEEIRTGEHNGNSHGLIIPTMSSRPIYAQQVLDNTLQFTEPEMTDIYLTQQQLEHFDQLFVEVKGELDDEMMDILYGKVT